MVKGAIVADDFLDNFGEFNDWARQQDYAVTHNPFDGVEYPDIVVLNPQAEIGQAVQSKASALNGFEVRANALFLRLTNAHTSTPPHQAHNDTAMGRMTFILYMQDGPGGTSLVRHKYSGMNTNPRGEFEHSLWARDTNVPEAWEIEEMFDMKANRAIMYPAMCMHRAEPIGGFGDDVETGRLVLTAFFDHE